MGKFSDTKYVKTIDSLVNASKDKIKNPYYIFSDKKPTKVTYYNQNVEKSTLDEASGLYGAHLGADSPFKFNKIKDFLIYGMGQINVDLDAGDFGLESSPIAGEVIILPNTIVPRTGDFFSVTYIKENLLFKITSVSFDTLDTGANIYSIQYSMEHIDAIEQIEAQVEKTFSFIVQNVGTDFKTLMESEDVNMLNEIEALIENLIVKFSSTFFDSRLQTFVFTHNGFNMYDPFMIEFLRKNNVLAYGDEYIHVDHAMATNRTFAMDYLKSFFYFLENPDEDLNPKVIATADLIQDPNSLFVTRLEDYYWVRHVDPNRMKSRFYVFDMDIIEHIQKNIAYEKGNKREYYNLWIAFFNNDFEYLKGDLLSKIKLFESFNNLECFYAMGITIYILEKYIEKKFRSK